MHAYAYTRYGAPDVLEPVERPVPTPGPKDLLIRVHASTVSAGDWRARSLVLPKGLGWAGRLIFGVFGPRRPVLGTELSGVVTATGSDVTRFKVGDAVIGFPGAKFGAHAEYIALHEDGPVVAKPANLSFEQAAALPFGATAAYDFLVNKGRIQPGERVLINGASGSVGSASVQIAKHLGAEVTAVSSARHSDLLRSLGADHVIDYTQQDFADTDLHYDVVVDTVGTAPWSRTRKALRPGGRMILIAGKTSDMLFGSLKARMSGKTLIGGVASESPDVLRAVVAMAASGYLMPVIDRSYSFDQIPLAHAHVDTGRKTGNVVITFPDAALAQAA